MVDDAYLVRIRKKGPLAILKVVKMATMVLATNPDVLMANSEVLNSFIRIMKNP